MRILTGVLILAPAGGIELCTYQDGGVLVERGHELDIQYQVDGPQHADYETAGMSVVGPVELIAETRRPVKTLRAFLHAWRLARRRKPDVLWLNRSEHIIWAQFLSTLLRVPIVTHLHHAPNFRQTNRLYRGVSSFISVSEHTRQQWIDAGIPAEKIAVVHNSIPLEAYPVGDLPERQVARARLGLDDGARVALYCGRLTREKGVDTLVEAWRRRSDPNAVLVLVGRAETDTSWLPEALDRLPAGSWRMFDETRDIVPFLHAADVVVVPTPEHEAFGRVVLEGLASGRPVLASRVGGIPEILTGAMERFLVPPADAGALADALDATLDWRTQEPTLGADARRWVEERFPYDAHVDAVEAALSSVARPPFGAKRLTPAASAGQS
ncbi:glycosyltransferase family 4 protein [Herbiconiux sp. L3-i23]|uniref:glycosyltransferase family 4 protein n=1 Tax=Herbiconiux sp. L3-i23 TaxID=2905871 RepID=UPI002068BFFC|nr:glycosyltransferase family 4 protein [Herbiconiux sp. L3-i23]BDI21655.1 glycosyl transferase [Herbiconiux sp. L3-i23]